MRYFKIKEEVSEGPLIGGAPVKIGYRRFLTDLLCTDTKLTSEQFYRVNALFKAFLDTPDGSILKIEDQDYAIIKLKIEAFVGSIKAVWATVPTCIYFLKYIEDLQKEDPEKADKKDGQAPNGD